MKAVNYLSQSLVLLGITLFSCTNENAVDQSDQTMVKLSKNEVLSIAYDDAPELSDNDLFDIVSSFINTDDNGITKSAVTSFNITKKTFINKGGEFDNEKLATKAVKADNDITAAICEVEFQHGSETGLALVAADAKLPTIIAFIPNKGSDFEMERSGANELIRASKASYLYKAIKTKELVDSLRQPTLDKISKELGIPVDEISYEKIENNIILTDAASSTKSTPVQGAPAGIQKLPSSIDPIVKTNWGQEDPYNGQFYLANLMDRVKTDNGGERYGPVPVGCVNVAIAQIMGCAYLRIPPHTFPSPTGNGATFVPNFKAMTDYPNIEKCTGSARIDIMNLLLALYKENKTTSKKDYSGAVTDSEVSEENMLKTMSRYFKYNKKDKFNGDLAWASLRNGNPVLMLTQSHAFVLSGILITEKAIQTRQLVKVNDVYWYANLGWANSATGYYQLDDKADTYFEAGGLTEWSYKMDYINNIKANK